MSYIYIDLDEAKMVRAAMNGFAATANSGEYHWSLMPEYQDLQRRVNKFIDHSVRK